MPHEQPTTSDSHGLNSPSPLSVSFNMINRNKICIDHDLDEPETNNNQCFELESVP